jgi:hypothetical protein
MARTCIKYIKYILIVITNIHTFNKYLVLEYYAQIIISIACIAPILTITFILISAMYVLYVDVCCEATILQTRWQFMSQSCWAILIFNIHFLNILEALIREPPSLNSNKIPKKNCIKFIHNEINK